jgi:hypothetical protein
MVLGNHCVTTVNDNITFFQKLRKLSNGFVDGFSRLNQNNDFTGLAEFGAKLFWAVASKNRKDLLRL